MVPQQDVRDEKKLIVNAENFDQQDWLLICWWLPIFVVFLEVIYKKLWYVECLLEKYSRVPGFNFYTVYTPYLFTRRKKSSKGIAGYVHIPLGNFVLSGKKTGNNNV